MLLIPLPMLIKARLPTQRKIILCGVFSLGILVILCSILNRYYNFTSGYGSLIYLNWYAGEASTAIMVANIPHCWPLLSRIFSLGSFKSNGPSGYADTTSQSKSNPRFRLGSAPNTRMRSNAYGISQNREEGDADSIERIVGKGANPAKRDGDEHVVTGGDMTDLELGDLSSTTPTPKYEAHATAERTPDGLWVPRHVDGRPQVPPVPIANGGVGGIVKTVHMDQRYEGE